MNASRLFLTTSLAITGLFASWAGIAATAAEIDQRVVTTLTEFDALNKTNASLRKKAAGVLVFPRVTKAGVGVAAEFGEGALQVDGKTVGYYNRGAGSMGLTLGAAQHSEAILFMTKDALDKFVKSDGWSVGADAGITVVKESMDADYDTMTDKKQILAFGFAEKGLIGDLSLDGSKITRIKK